jgi:hypothetical protein
LIDRVQGHRLMNGGAGHKTDRCFSRIVDSKQAVDVTHLGELTSDVEKHGAVSAVSPRVIADEHMAVVQVRARGAFDMDLHRRPSRVLEEDAAEGNGLLDAVRTQCAAGPPSAVEAERKFRRYDHDG